MQCSTHVPLWYCHAGLRQSVFAQHAYAPWTATLRKYDSWQYILHTMGQADTQRLDMLARHTVLHDQAQAVDRNKYSGWCILESEAMRPGLLLQIHQHVLL